MDIIRKSLLVSFLSVVVIGCASNSYEPDAVPPTQRQNTTLRLDNTQNEKVYYFLVERETAAVVLWTPTVTEKTPSIEAQESVWIPYKDIVGYDDNAKEAIFFWWTNPGDFGNTASNVQSEVLLLQ